MAGNTYMIRKLAIGLFNEWRSETAENRRNMVRQVYRMDGGPERVAAMRFLRMVEAAQKAGEA